MKSPAVEMALLLSGQQSVITIPRLFIDLVEGDFAAAALLSQVMYWFEKMGRKEFYKTDDDWKDEIGLSPYQVSRARKTLEQFGVTTARKGVPAKMHYSLNLTILENKLSSFLGTGYAVSSELVTESLENSPYTEDYTGDYTGDPDSQKKPSIVTRAPVAEETTPEWYMATYNAQKPAAWKVCVKMTEARRKSIRAHIREHREDAHLMFTAALLYVTHDKYWNNLDIGFDTIFTKGHLTQWAEGAASALLTGNDPSKSSIEKRQDRIRSAMQ